MATLGDLLRKHRKARGVTQTELAIAIGRKQSEIYRWEKSIVRIPAEELPLIAQTLGIAVEHFFPEEHFSPPEEETLHA